MCHKRIAPILAVLAAACGDGIPDDSSATETDLPPTDVDTDTDLVTDTGTYIGGPLAFTAAPEVTPNPNTRAGLVKILTVATNKPTTLSVLVTSGSFSQTLAFDTRTRSHDVALLGLPADRTYSVEVTAIAGPERQTAAPVATTTEPLPPNFPTFDLQTAELDRVEPGLILTSGHKWMFIMDTLGTVLWYYEASSFVYEVHRTEDGLLRFNVDGPETFHERKGRIAEIDMRGTLIRGWAPAGADDPAFIPLDPSIEVLHHDVHPAPDGGLFSLTLERIDEPAYPTSETDPLAPTAPATLAGDVVVEVGPDGSLLGSWPIQDYIPPTRIGYGSVKDDWWRMRYGDFTHDWTHGNAVEYDAARDEVIVSLRQQDSILFIDRATGELNSLLAPPGNWEPHLDAKRFKSDDPSFRWLWHQHSPEVMPNGNLLVFDNGNNRANAYERRWPPQVNVSRAIEVSLDHENRKVERVWSFSHRRNPRVFSTVRGDADYLPQTGNIFVTFGSVWGEPDGVQARLVEVTHTDPPEVVWELAMDRGTFRAGRIDAIYP